MTNKMNQTRKVDHATAELFSDLATGKHMARKVTSAPAHVQWTEPHYDPKSHAELLADLDKFGI